MNPASGNANPEKAVQRQVSAARRAGGSKWRSKVTLSPEKPEPPHAVWQDCEFRSRFCKSASCREGPTWHRAAFSSLQCLSSDPAVPQVFAGKISRKVSFRWV